jgi:hypothetical protein
MKTLMGPLLDTALSRWLVVPMKRILRHNQSEASNNHTINTGGHHVINTSSQGNRTLEQLSTGIPSREQSSSMQAGSSETVSTASLAAKSSTGQVREGSVMLPQTRYCGYSSQNGVQIHRLKHISSQIMLYMDNAGYFYTYSQFDREYWPISPREAMEPINSWVEEKILLG